MKEEPTTLHGLKRRRRRWRMPNLTDVAWLMLCVFALVAFGAWVARAAS